jgi:hypothetical protein
VAQPASGIPERAGEAIDGVGQLRSRASALQQPVRERSLSTSVGAARAPLGA